MSVPLLVCVCVSLSVSTYLSGLVSLVDEFEIQFLLDIALILANRPALEYNVSDAFQFLA